MVGQRPLARQRPVAAADQPHVRDRVMGARHGRVVTRAARSPVRAAMRWRRVVSKASARLIAARMGLRPRARVDGPAPGTHSLNTRWAHCLGSLSRCVFMEER
jgi:hypothetical protein